MISLAVKYRPKTFEDVVCQDSVKTILMNQIQTGEFKQGYLFTGSAGCGKTTSARIFANEINEGKGKPIEIDGASNNGVDNVRSIIDDCRMKSLDSKYKVYIIDEVHMLSIGAFNALLKVLEEPPKGVIFIMCTTDPQKIPATILSRVQRFDFKRIPTYDIRCRLISILDKEHKRYEIEALDYIAKLANGGMRDAIMKLDTVLGYTNEVTLDITLKCLGVAFYDSMIGLIKNVFKKQRLDVIDTVEELFYDGKDLKIFIRDTVQFILDLIKFSMTSDMNSTMIPGNYENIVKVIVKHITTDGLIELLQIFTDINKQLKYEQNPLQLIESELMLACR